MRLKFGGDPIKIGDILQQAKIENTILILKYIFKKRLKFVYVGQNCF